MSIDIEKYKIDIEKNDEIFGGVNLLTKLLHEMDDRGLVLSLSAFAEDALGFLLKSFMLHSETTSKLIEGFNAPLGTFSARIKAGYALGLITEEQFQDLERLRKIRNEFAHTWKPTDLSKPKILAIVKEMNYSRFEEHFPETLKEKARSSLICLLMKLQASSDKISKDGLQAKQIGNSLIVGFSGDFKEQVQSARVKLKDILQKLEGSKKEERQFYINKLRQFRYRVVVLKYPETSDQKKELFVLIKEVEDAISKYCD